MSEMSLPSPVPDSALTPEEHAALAPLLQLAAVGTGQDLVARHTPDAVRRAHIKARFLAELREHGTITKAAAAAGITPRTVQRWQHDDPEFLAQIERWKHVDQADELALTLHEIAKRGLTDPRYANAAVRAAEAILKAIARDEFGDHQRIEQTVTVNQQVQVVHEVQVSLRDKALARLKTIDAEPAPLPSS